MPEPVSPETVMVILLVIMVHSISNLSAVTAPAAYVISEPADAGRLSVVTSPPAPKALHAILLFICRIAGHSGPYARLHFKWLRP